jgi:hypothetical protein
MLNEILEITGETALGDLSEWLEERGYVWEMMRPSVIRGDRPERFDGTGVVTVWEERRSKPFVLFGRPGEPTLIATEGSTLVWDGTTISVT